MEDREGRIRELFRRELHLRGAYARYLSHLHPPALQERFRAWLGEGEKHIQSLEGALEGKGPGESKALSEEEEPPDLLAHSLLRYFYEAEEKLYYLYLNASKLYEGEGLHSMLESHLQDQMKHLADIQDLYSESLYY